ncbi:WD40 repeat-like protein [Dacryopinax primogenitus]|uniref:WD40 repeat-like protein n=1 Tax=Dacryopinax primogenitus (strain DJM 731) TaxID=1858805 RepID=M5GD93_DACPD|nr:WD40 repeat-like protein [Dacryopinax primogenitus]EJU06670.1 WD40 repeat-like protein [Dacryopinax primogenitus]
MDNKRRAPSPPSTSSAVTKRARQDSSGPPANNQIAISSGADAGKALVRSVKRTSSLDAPIVSLAGAHSAEILSCRFDPTGQNVAACSADRGISLWRTYPPNTNYALLTTIHKAPVLDIQWSLTRPELFSCSADKVVAVTDLTTGTRTRRWRGHTGVVNTIDRAIAGGTELVASGSDDGYVCIWDGDEKDAVIELAVGSPVTAVCWSGDGTQLFVGGLDNVISVFDLRREQIVYSLPGHTDTIASLALSPSHNHLLSTSFDSTVIIHDIRPFSSSPTRVHRTLYGAPAGNENALLRGAWSRTGEGWVGVGGADRTVTIWEVDSGKVVYKLPGHKGTVMAVDFHPKEPIVLTGSKDATMLLGELDNT